MSVPPCHKCVENIQLQILWWSQVYSTNHSASVPNLCCISTCTFWVVWCILYPILIRSDLRQNSSRTIYKKRTNQNTSKMSSSHPNGTSNSYPPSARSSSYVTDSKADLVSMELSEGRNQVWENATEHLIKS